MAEAQEPVAVNSEFVTDIVVAGISELALDESSPKGKKRAQKEKDTTQERPKKRARNSGTTASEAPKAKIQKLPSPQKPTKAKAKILASKISVKWKTLPPTKIESVENQPEDVEVTDLRPRIWTNNREELLATLPEFSGKMCFNGMSWSMYETPLLLLDAVNTCFEISREGMDSLSLDLITTRSFVCPIPQPENTENPSHVLSTIVSESQPLAEDQAPKISGKLGTRRRAPQYKTSESVKMYHIPTSEQERFKLEFMQPATPSSLPANISDSKGSLDTVQIATDHKMQDATVPCPTNDGIANGSEMILPVEAPTDTKKADVFPSDRSGGVVTGAKVKKSGSKTATPKKAAPVPNPNNHEVSNSGKVKTSDGPTAKHTTMDAPTPDPSSLMSANVVKTKKSGAPATARITKDAPTARQSNSAVVKGSKPKTSRGVAATRKPKDVPIVNPSSPSISAAVHETISNSAAHPTEAKYVSLRGPTNPDVASTGKVKISGPASAIRKKTDVPAPASNLAVVNDVKVKVSGAAALKSTEIAVEQVDGKKRSKFWAYAVEAGADSPIDNADGTIVPISLSGQGKTESKPENPVVHQDIFMENASTMPADSSTNNSPGVAVNSQIYPSEHSSISVVTIPYFSSEDFGAKVEIPGPISPSTSLSLTSSRSGRVRDHPFFAPPVKSQKSVLYDHLIKEAEERFGILPPPPEKPTAPEVPNDTAYHSRASALLSSFQDVPPNDIRMPVHPAFPPEVVPHPQMQMLPMNHKMLLSSIIHGISDSHKNLKPDHLFKGKMKAIVGHPYDPKMPQASSSKVTLDDMRALEIPRPHSPPSLEYPSPTMTPTWPLEMPLKNEIVSPHPPHPPHHPQPAVEPIVESDSIMIGENSDAMNLVAPEEPKQPPPAHTEEFLNVYIPPSLPEELRALIDSYLFGRPLTVMISRGRLREHWSLKLPDEFGYAMMGYFRILGVQETRLQSSIKDAKKIPVGFMSGQVQWRFHLQWAPGGEEYVLPQYDEATRERPWWAPDPVSSPSVGEEQQTLDEPESHYPTTSHYRAARIAHPEYKFRHDPLSDLYNYLVPELLLAPFGPRNPDRVLPRGWFCVLCGRMVFQAALRHRSCPSSFCKDKEPPAEPYHQELLWLRDPQERLPINCPFNKYPEPVTAKVIKWEDGTQTYSYYIQEAPDVFIKHIFTSNIPRLQEEASALMKDIQLQVPLIRPMVNNSPYFFYSAASPSDNLHPTKTAWASVPACINPVKEELVYRTSWFAEVKDEDLSVNCLKIVAWITSGSKRGVELIRAKKKCVTLLAMGCTTILNVTPRSMGGSIKVEHVEQSGENADEEMDTGWLGGNMEDDHMDVDEPTQSPKKPGRSVGKKKDQPTFSLSLFHGDTVVFFGDDFEYSIKRDGTSFFVFTSHDEVAPAGQTVDVSTRIAL